ncbi:hypothetical protein MKZ08_20305 [Viridibacillus sp. FSL R5-0477]|uniref:Uncharacterized protein n=1 Tax=Viridibacillus arenosi FSL R5-213 TaxID=1227360 RepID=W4F5I0_9BACL|nr:MULTISPECIES: hypothetical protein [Viridibacillus]ETT87386.1 hypothetical protein C176_04518 [Viridibacillus arenosi FSL R5-213]OMC82456.1 hypothetical protein BK130_10790 [Viridibacillus sp. FSL H8-0123]OMC87796.1 hypothetical protein BK128_05605 [Viridibacillus sp. FSL H7-0596]OMC91344.1 hypothetical protein BK137_09720 [Viridibacillus arenosi]
MERPEIPADKKIFTDLPYLDNPDVVDTDSISLFDLHEDMQTVDAIPVEELNDKVKDEDNHHGTKSTSSTKRRYARSKEDIET